MVHHNRSEEKVNIDILQTILDKRKNGEKAKQQQLIYGANLSFAMVRRYVPRLVNEGLATETIEGNHRLYDITQRGIDYLREAKAVDRALNQP